MISNQMINKYVTYFILKPSLSNQVYGQLRKLAECELVEEGICLGRTQNCNIIDEIKYLDIKTSKQTNKLKFLFYCFF
jgi:hypothetical protein